MKHLVLVGACYLDTILSVPFLPSEDSKLRATDLQVRRGGNCPNTLEVLHQLLTSAGSSKDVSPTTPQRSMKTHLVSPLPGRDCAATSQILSSFGDDVAREGGRDTVTDLSHCLYREGHTAPASSYIIRSSETGSRTIINHNGLPEMTTSDFVGVVMSLMSSQPGKEAGDYDDDDDDEWWFHFEGRIPETTLECIRYLRGQASSQSSSAAALDILAGRKIRVSVEVEKPDREGLRELAAEADVVVYSKSWAEASGYTSAEACLRGETIPRAIQAFCTWGADGAACLSRNRQDTSDTDETSTEADIIRCSVRESDITVVDSVGAGDTFIAGILFGLTRHAGRWDSETILRFGVDVATLKVQQEGFRGLASAMESHSR